MILFSMFHFIYIVVLSILLCCLLSHLFTSKHYYQQKNTKINKKITNKKIKIIFFFLPIFFFNDCRDKLYKKLIFLRFSAFAQRNYSINSLICAKKVRMKSFSFNFFFFSFCVWHSLNLDPIKKTAHFYLFVIIAKQTCVFRLIEKLGKLNFYLPFQKLSTKSIFVNYTKTCQRAKLSLKLDTLACNDSKFCVNSNKFIIEYSDNK